MAKLKPIEQLADDVNVGDFVRFPVGRSEISGYFLKTLKELQEESEDPTKYEGLGEHIFASHKAGIFTENNIPKEEIYEVELIDVSISKKKINSIFSVDSYEILRRAKKK